MKKHKSNRESDFTKTRDQSRVRDQSQVYDQTKICDSKQTCDSSLSDREERIAAYVCGELDGARGEKAKAARGDTSQESLAFERQMASDPALAAEVRAYREALSAAQAWLKEAPPGIERAKAIPIPALHPAPARSSSAGESSKPVNSGLGQFAIRIMGLVHWRPMRPAFAFGFALAIFAAGFWTGRGAQINQALQIGQAARSQSAQDRQTAQNAQSAQSASASGSSEGSAQSDPASIHPASTHPGRETTPAPQAPSAVPPASSSSGDREMAALNPRTIVRDESGRMTIENNRPSGGTQSVWVIDNSLSLE